MRSIALAAAALAGLSIVAPSAGAQDYRPGYRQGTPLRLNVRPRSWLDAGRVVAPYSAVNPASAYGQTVSYLNNPPWQNMRDRFGEGTLPDPVTNGPFAGATNILGPVDINGLLLGEY